MHLVIDFRMYNASGIGRYIRSIVKHLLEKKIFKITLLGNKVELLQYDWLSGIDIINCNARIYSVKEQIELALKAPRCDILWSPHYNIPLLPIKAKKRIVTIHDAYHLAFIHTLKLHQKLYAKVMMSKAIEKSDVILTVSNFSKKEIIKYTGTNRNIEVVYNGIEDNWTVDKPLSPYKRGNYFLFKISNVKFYGYLSKEELFELYKKMDIGIGTLSLYENEMQEASPLKVREYVAFRLPVILGYKDTDLEGKEYILNIGNYENNVIDNIDRIRKFINVSDKLSKKVDPKIISYEKK